MYVKNFGSGCCVSVAAAVAVAADDAICFICTFFHSLRKAFDSSCSNNNNNGNVSIAEIYFSIHLCDVLFLFCFFSFAAQIRALQLDTRAFRVLVVFSIGSEIEMYPGCYGIIRRRRSIIPMMIMKWQEWVKLKQSLP